MGGWDGRVGWEGRWESGWEGGWEGVGMGGWGERVWGRSMVGMESPGWGGVGMGGWGWKGLGHQWSTCMYLRTHVV